jgi:toxin YoeB
MRKVTFEVSAFQDFVDWATLDRKIYQRIANLILDILRHPFSGIGKPEPLKYELRGIGHDALMMSIGWCTR